MLVEWRDIKEVLNNNFTFSDLSPRFKNIDDSSGNIFCPFHENNDTPAAKMYWDEEKEIWIIHCFGECHRNFSTYDYVDLILCLRYQKYKSPLDFLQKNMDPRDLRSQLKACQLISYDESQSYYTEKVNYINSVYDTSNSISEFIEVLYTS